jgi:hypothetical protein
MGFRNPAKSADPTATALDTGVSTGKRTIVDAAGVRLYAGYSGEVPATLAAGVLTNEDGSHRMGSWLDITSPDGVAGVHLASEELSAGGYEAVVRLTGDAIDLDAGEIRIRGVAQGQPLPDPITVQINGAGATFSTGGPHAIHGPYVVDPAALFGAGYGAVVIVDAQIIGDSTAGRWDMELHSGTAAAPTTIYAQDSRVFNNRETLRISDSYVIAPGATKEFGIRLLNGTQVLVIYTDDRNNRLKLTVIPIAA